MTLNLDELAWTIAKGKTDEYDFEIRIRHFHESLETNKFPQRLNIFWSLRESFENGFPTESELKRVHKFEDKLVEAVENDEFSILSIVLTGRNEREFVFHTSNPQEFINRLTNMPQEEEPYPIEIHCNDDEEWEY
jgi:hypothetical protein